ncbi:MAG: RNA-binding protein [Polyangiaceae bacterium]|nr:RNA-binding protein [Polyangiaceae bacterium]
MSKRLFVGNLSYSTRDESLRAAFEPHGSVVSATVVLDRATGQSRGFGFVEFGSDSEAEKAVEAMNGAMVDGRPLVVNAAREREGGRGGGFGGGRGGGGGGFGGGGGGFGGGGGGYGGGGGGGGYGGGRGGGGGGRGGGGRSGGSGGRGGGRGGRGGGGGGGRSWGDDE